MDGYIVDIWIPKVVDNLISADQNREIYRRLIKDAAEDSNSHLGGQLVYNKFLFKEYKSGRNLRIFSIVHNDKFVVMLFGAHRDENYIGGTYDGHNKFACEFNNKKLSEAEETKNAYAAIGAVYGFNTTESPLPLFTWDDGD